VKFLEWPNWKNPIPIIKSNNGRGQECEHVKSNANQLGPWVRGQQKNGKKEWKIVNFLDLYPGQIAVPQIPKDIPQ